MSTSRKVVKNKHMRKLVFTNLENRLIVNQHVNMWRQRVANPCFRTRSIKFGPVKTVIMADLCIHTKKIWRAAAPILAPRYQAVCPRKKPRVWPWYKTRYKAPSSPARQFFMLARVWVAGSPME